MNEIINKSNTEGQEQQFNLSIALLLLSYIFIPSFLSSVFFLLKIDAENFVYWLSLIMLCIIGYGLRKTLNMKSILTFIGITIVSHAISYLLFDISGDGLFYHQPAIDAYSNGLNPIYDSYSGIGSPWVTDYAKAMWYFSTSILSALGDIQFGKAYHLILLFASIFYAQYVVSSKSKFIKLIIILACLNPVIMYQYATFYVDGAVASLSTIGFFYAFRYFLEKDVSKLDHAIGLMALSLLACSKFTGLVYACAIIFTIGIYMLYSKRFKESLKLGWKLGTVFLVLITIIGFAPYITHLIEGKHIFHPLMGAEQINIMQGPQDTNIIFPTTSNTALKAIISYASKSSNEGACAVLKLPFTFSLSEWFTFSGNDVRVGGFGPLFSGILILSGITFYFFRGRAVIWGLGLLLFMTLLNPEAWWARYVPFVWIIPFILMIGVKSSSARIKSLIPITAVVLSIMNLAGIFGVFTISQVTQAMGIHALLSPHYGEVVLVGANKNASPLLSGFFSRYKISREDLSYLPNLRGILLPSGNPIIFLPNQNEAPSFSNDLERFLWYKKRAEDGDVGALYAMSIFYRTGIGTDMNDNEADYWLIKAADKGYPEAQSAIGQWCDARFTDYKKEKNYKEAALWYLKAANQGFKPAQRLLIGLYLRGWGVEKSYYETIKWLLRLIW